MEQRRIPSAGSSRPLTAGASHLGTCSDMPRWWWYLRYLLGLTSHTRSVLQMEALPEGRSVMKQGMLSPGCTTPDSGATCNIWKKHPTSHRGAVSLSWTLLYATSLQETQDCGNSLPSPSLREMQLIYSENDHGLCCQTGSWVSLSNPVVPGSRILTEVFRFLLLNSCLSPSILTLSFTFLCTFLSSASTKANFLGSFLSVWLKINL